jgi:hypothetical protein
VRQYLHEHHYYTADRHVHRLELATTRLGAGYSEQGHATSEHHDQEISIISGVVMAHAFFVLARAACLVMLFLFSRAYAVVAEGAQKWFLMARHGECAEISSLSINRRMS